MSSEPVFWLAITVCDHIQNTKLAPVNQSKGAGSAGQAESSKAGDCDHTYTMANPS